MDKTLCVVWNLKDWCEQIVGTPDWRDQTKFLQRLNFHCSGHEVTLDAEWLRKGFYWDRAFRLQPTTVKVCFLRNSENFWCNICDYLHLLSKSANMYMLHLFMKEWSHLDVIFVTSALLILVAWIEILNQFMKERSHLNVTFVTTAAVKKGK